MPRKIERSTDPRLMRKKTEESPETLSDSLATYVGGESATKERR